MQTMQLEEAQLQEERGTQQLCERQQQQMCEQQQR